MGDIYQKLTCKQKKNKNKIKWIAFSKAIPPSIRPIFQGDRFVRAVYSGNRGNMRLRGNDGCGAGGGVLSFFKTKPPSDASFTPIFEKR